LKIAPFPRYAAHRTVQPQNRTVVVLCTTRTRLLYIKIIATAFLYHVYWTLAHSYLISENIGGIRRTSRV